MKWRFWKKKKSELKTILQISASEGGIQTLYVETQGPEKALELMQKLKELARE